MHVFKAEHCLHWGTEWTLTRKRTKNQNTTLLTEGSFDCQNTTNLISVLFYFGQSYASLPLHVFKIKFPELIDRHVTVCTTAQSFHVYEL